MARRGYERRVKCDEDGCREWRTTRYEYKRDFADAVQREKGQPPWKCLRHARPERVLGVHNREITAECGRVETGVYNRPTWEGADSSGWAHGPGFMAWAEDFPIGTRLIITARVELPEDFTPPAPPIAVPPPSRYAADAQDLDL